MRARLIGRGSEAGIEDGYPVINLYGLVGRVYETGRRSARVLLLTDLNSRVPVMADRSNARAILIGDNSPYPRLEYVGRAPDIQEGDRIVSSGDDGILPRGLPVGEAIPTREGGWRVRLYSDQAPIDFVWVWPYHRITPPDEEVDTSEAELVDPDALGPAVADVDGTPQGGAEQADARQTETGDATDVPATDAPEDTE